MPFVFWHSESLAGSGQPDGGAWRHEWQQALLGSLAHTEVARGMWYEFAPDEACSTM